MSSSKGRITEKTSESIDAQIKHWKLEEINMNKILKLENCRGNVELIAFSQDKNFFDLFNNLNGFAIIVDVIENDDNFSIEPVKQLLEKAVLVQFKSNRNQKLMMLIIDSATGTLETLDLKRIDCHQTFIRFLEDVYGNLFE